MQTSLWNVYSIVWAKFNRAMLSQWGERPLGSVDGQNSH